MKMHHIGFAIAGSILTIIFLIAVNFLTTPSYLWFIYPAFAIILWPMSLFFINKGEYKLLSVFGSVVLLTFLITINVVHSPAHPWVLYATFPIVCWPVSMLWEDKAKTISFALAISFSAMLYYTILNLFISPSYPWAIYPAFVVLWWPLVLYYVTKKNYFGLSLSGSLLMILFFISVNLVSSPDVIWAIYPIFIILWWPLSMYYFHYKKNLIFLEENYDKNS